MLRLIYKKLEGHDDKMSCALFFVSKSDFSVRGRQHTINSSMLNYIARGKLCEGLSC